MTAESAPSRSPGRDLSAGRARPRARPPRPIAPRPLPHARRQQPLPAPRPFASAPRPRAAAPPPRSLSLARSLSLSRRSARASPPPPPSFTHPPTPPRAARRCGSRRRRPSSLWRPARIARASPAHHRACAEKIFLRGTHRPRLITHMHHRRRTLARIPILADGRIQSARGQFSPHPPTAGARTKRNRAARAGRDPAQAGRARESAERHAKRDSSADFARRRRGARHSSRPARARDFCVASQIKSPAREDDATPPQPAAIGFLPIDELALRQSAAMAGPRDLSRAFAKKKKKAQKDFVAVCSVQGSGFGLGGSMKVL